MDSDSKFRIIRILFILLSLTLIISLRADFKTKLMNSTTIYNSLINSLNIVDLKNETENDKYLSNHTVKVTNNASKEKEFTISFKEKDNNTLDFNFVKYEIKENGKMISTGIIDNDNLYRGKIAKKTSNNYEISFWIDENTIIEQNAKFSGEINIY